MSSKTINTHPRFDSIGKITFMAEAKKYVMVRRPYCMPFVLPVEKWLALSTEQDDESRKEPPV